MCNHIYLLIYHYYIHIYTIGISDSLRENTLMNCEKYEVNGTTYFIDCNGPKISRICKQKLVKIYLITISIII